MSERIIDLISTIAALRRASQRTLAVRAGLSLAQLSALTYLGDCNRFSDTPAAVAEYLNATRGTTSQTLRTLEAKGLISRHGDANDGRLQHLHLTPAGRRIVRAAGGDEIAQAVATLQLEGGELTSLLENVLRTAQQARGGRTFGVCATCKHLEGAAGHRVCGLTREPLRDSETTRRCVEHDPLAA